MTKTITILGSTGSIGRQTLSVADELGLRVAALTAERNVDLMEAQCRKYRPKLAVLADEAAAEELKVRLADMNIRVLAGAEALCEAAALPEADTVVVAVCGFAALRPTLTAIHAKKRIALANKETMVCAGEIMQSAARESGAEIIPVDSEHSAIFQCLMGCRDRAGQTPDFNLLRRAVFREDAGKPGLHDQIGRAAPPELENGRENHG